MLGPTKEPKVTPIVLGDKKMFAQPKSRKSLQRFWEPKNIGPNKWAHRSAQQKGRNCPQQSWSNKHDKWAKSCSNKRANSNSNTVGVVGHFCPTKEKKGFSTVSVCLLVFMYSETKLKLARTKPTHQKLARMKPTHERFNTLFFRVRASCVPTSA